MNIFVRYAHETDFLPNNFITKAYDDRILFILEGQGKIIINGEEFPISKNFLCYYPAGTPYQPISSKEDPLRFITINFDFERDFENITSTLRPVRATDFDPNKVLYKGSDTRESAFKKPIVIQDASYRAKLCEFIHYFKSNTVYGKRIAETILQTLCYKILNKEHESHNELYLRLKEYIDTNYKNIQINKDISTIFCYHDYYLNKVFKKNSGTSIHKYIIDRRIQEAAYLIASTEMPLCDIAFSVGFSNVAHFSTVFKAKYSVTPSCYRRDSFQKYQI